MFFYPFIGIILTIGGGHISTLNAIWRGLDWSFITNILLTIIPALLCITLHELAHGYVAYKLGDNTAKEAGRLTLNPIKHIDIMGLAMMVVFKFGWAKPVPINMRKFKNPKRGMAISAAAGPISNLLIAVVVLFLYGLLYIPLGKLGNAGDYIAQMLYLTAYLSIALAIFNVIPIPPLDGSKVLYAFLSDAAYWKLMRYERYGMIFLIALIYMLNNMNVNPLGTAVSYVFDKLLFVAQFGFDIVSKFV
ncbi:MAG: site-2 protease family protein [Clostridia bacterium]|nr:site-2 protease family protein [Clostridia bacterium]